jgi:hypothetical protein
MITSYRGRTAVVAQYDSPVDEELQGLSRDVDRLFREVSAIRTDVASLAALSTLVRGLADRVADLAAADGGPVEGGPVSWFDADEAQASAILLPLAQWLTSVGVAHRVLREQLSDCWYRHPAVVDGLNALRAGWIAAYRDPAARTRTAIEWHIRHLPGAVELLRQERLRDCSEFDHQPDGPIDRERRPTYDERALREFAAEWASARG